MPADDVGVGDSALAEQQAAAAIGGRQPTGNSGGGEAKRADGRSTERRDGAMECAIVERLIERGELRRARSARAACGERECIEPDRERRIGPPQLPFEDDAGELLAVGRAASAAADRPCEPRVVPAALSR